GGLDLSVGAVAGMAVTISAMTMVIYAQVGGVAIALVLLAGALIGAVNALLIVVLRIPDLLATLATMFIVMGLKLVPVDGQSVSSGMVLRDGSVAPGRFTPDFLAIDRAFVGPIPLPVLIVGVISVATWFFLTRTRRGRLMYAVDANPEASRLAGGRVGGYRVPPAFLAIGRAVRALIPLPVLTVGVSSVATWFFLTRTRWGRLMYAVGANPEASRLAGVRVGRYRALAYVLSGVFAAIGGLILSA